MNKSQSNTSRPGQPGTPNQIQNPSTQARQPTPNSGKNPSALSHDLANMIGSPSSQLFFFLFFLIYLSYSKPKKFTRFN